MGDISRALGVSYPTIRKALSGEYNESNADERKLALRIRKFALNHGGEELVPTKNADK